MVQKVSPSITAVLLDFGMVLTGPPVSEAWQRLCDTLALAPDVFHQRYWATRHDYDRGALNGEAYWRGIAERDRQSSLTPDTLSLLYAADVDVWTDINHPMLRWAQRLQQRGLRVGILSNMGDRMVEGLFAKLPWLSAFNHHTWSHALGVAKPEPAIYWHAAAGLATSPENILFIDDKAENVTAARQTGMQAVQYTRWPEFLERMRDAGFAPLIEGERDTDRQESYDGPFL